MYLSLQVPDEPYIGFEPHENILQKCVYFNIGDAEQVEDGR